MPKPLKNKTNNPKRPGIPPEAKRIEILLALLNLKHFHGIWYNGFTLSVRHFADGAPDHLPWQEAIDLIEAAHPRKPVQFETRNPGAASKAAGGG